jgi:hypothetical protein
MLSVFVIASEHQLFQVERVISDKLKGSEVLIICERRIKDKSTLVEAQKIYEIIYFDSWKFFELNSKCTEFKNILLEIRKRSNRINVYSSQYSADYSLLMYNILKPITIYLLDEGTASIKVAINRRKKYQIKKFVKYFVKSIYYGCLIYEPCKIVYLSDYELELSKNDILINLANNRIKNDLGAIGNEVHIIGSSLVEAKLIDENTYIKYLKCLCDVRDNICYYSHRNENKNKLILIESLGCKIIENSVPYEKNFMNMAIKPKEIIAIISPVVYNIANTYDLIPTLSVLVIESKYFKRNNEVYVSIYKEFSKNKRINIINFDIYK